MAVPSVVMELVDRFHRNLDVYKNEDYKETRVRVEFIDPLFEALGWDVRNVQGHAEQYKDVMHEAALKVGGEARAPDYFFRIGGVRKFFLEANKPSVSVKGDIAPAYQLRRYAWSAKLPLSVLTDLLSGWVDGGWLEVADPSRRGRKYRLAEEYWVLLA